MTVTRKCVVAKVYGFSYAKPLLEFEAKLGEKKQNVYKISKKMKNWRRFRLTCAQVQLGLLNENAS